MAEIYVPGAIDIMGSANQMMQFRNSQQAQQANALQMQYAAEDRARAEQGRRAAAGNALAERAALSKAIANSVVGVAGPEQPNLGNAQKDLAMQGRFGAASAISNVQEQFAKQKEQEAKAAGQSLTNVKTGVETEEKRADVTKKAIEIQRQSFDYAQDLPTLKALITASYTPGHPLSEFHAINGVTLEQALKSIDDLAAKGKTFEQIREQMSQGAAKAADNIAARGLVTAQTDKAVAETAQVGKPAAVTPTNLAKLITEEAALPEGSADKARYAAAIAKELAMSDVAQTDLGKAVSERAKLKQGDPLIAQYDAYIAKLVSATTAATIPAGYRLKPNGDLEFIPGGPADPKVANKATPAPASYRYKADGSGDLEAIPGGPEAGKATGAAAKGEDAILAAEDAVGVIDKLLKHPGFSEAVGASFGTSYFSGTDARGAIALHNQILGTAFLDAYNTLRGTGSISEIEGTKATSAKARMDLSTNEKDYTDAANEFRDILMRGIEREKARIQKTGGANSSAAGGGVVDQSNPLLK
jgi:hypothetical protein